LEKKAVLQPSTSYGNDCNIDKLNTNAKEVNANVNSEAQIIVKEMKALGITFQSQRHSCLLIGVKDFFPA
jgi:hypothetical protein